jgi:hypothetical protein
MLKEASRILSSPEQDLSYSAIQGEFTWMKSGEIVWIRRPDFRSVLFWVRSGHQPTVLNQEKRLENVSFLLNEMLGRLPGNLGATDLAAALRKLTTDPRGFVASQAFLATVRPYRSVWTLGDVQLEHLLESHCPDPVLQLRNDGKWNLEFQYFNPMGGVEAWTAKGSSTRVITLDRSVAVADGTFRFPFR